MDTAGGEVCVMQIGDAVKITGGPFAGLHGRLKASGPRVLIVVEIHGRQLDVELDLDWVSEAVPESLSVSAV